MLKGLFLSLIGGVYSYSVACNTNMCPTEWKVRLTQGNGVCNFECMVDGCNFDSKSGWRVEDGDCYSQCINNSMGQCDKVKLANTSCDDVCNVPECGWDNGYCSSCALGCTIELLYNNQLDTSCNVMGCMFDFMKGKCSPTCWTTEQNSACDMDCMPSSCNNDSSTGLMKDSECLNYCLNQGCTLDLLNNYVCDAVCNHKGCGYDNGMCGYCNTACFLNELRDGNEASLGCDNSSECGWDNDFDQGCQKDRSYRCYTSLYTNSACDPVCGLEIECLQDNGQCNKCNNDPNAYYLPNGTCKCRNGKCFNNSTGKCTDNCLTNCDICSTNSNCIQCKYSDPFYSYNFSTSKCECAGDHSEVKNGKCVCSNGYYATGLSPLVCTACPPDCATCYGGSICETCKNPPAVPVKTGGCACPDGTYAISSNPTVCGSCDITCATCTNGTSCVTCKYAIMTKNLITNLCDCPANSSVSITANYCVCNDSYYDTDLTALGITCTACNNTCKTCVNTTTCLTCTNTFVFSGISGSSLCICPTNSTLNPTVPICECNASFYDSDLTAAILTCTACNSSCATCTDGSTCTTCKYTTMVKATIGCECPTNSSDASTPGTCVCLDGFYDSDTTSAVSCTVCASSCTTCIDGSTCASCKDTFLGPNGSQLCYCPSNSSLNAGGTACVCDTGFYDSDSTTAVLSCTGCHATCGSCSNGTTCITCNIPSMTIDTVGCICGTNTVFSGGSCVCVDGYYDSDSTSAVYCDLCYNRCLTCDDFTTCKTCKSIYVGPDSNGICNCPANSSLNAAGTACECDLGYYDSDSTGNVVCTECSDHCSSCSNSFSCSICMDTFYYSPSVGCICPSNSHLSTSSETCECDTGYYDSDPSTSVVVCSLCNNHCISCNQANICLTCKVTFTAPDLTSGCLCGTNARINDLNNGCVCIDGYDNVSTNPKLLSCKDCYDHCSDCDNPSTCLSCKDSSLIPSSTKGCICPYGKYDSDSNDLIVNCMDCYYECTNCKQADLCITCKMNYATPSSTLGCDCPLNAEKDTVNQVCICKDGYYSSTKSVLECNPCPIYCKTCNSYGNCLTCKSSDMIIQLGICIYDCSSGYYGTTESCVECNSLCKECTNSSTNCSSCVKNAHLSSKNECVCESGYSLDSLGCKADVNGDISYNISILSSNEVGLHFDVPPYFDTKAENYVVTIDGVVIKDFELVMIDKNNYKIIVNGVEIDPKNTKIDVTLVNPNDSTAIYRDDIEEIDQSDEEEDELPYYIEAALPYVILGQFLLGLCPWLFSGTWLTINSLQLLTFIPLMNIKLSSLSYSFLKALNMYNIVPNLFHMFIEAEHDTYQILNDYDFRTSIFLNNCGSFMLILLALPILTLAVFLIQILPQCKSFSNKLKYTFYYYTFIRFAIEAHLPMGLAGVVQVIYPSMEDPMHGSNFILGLLFIILSLLYPIISFIVIFRNYKNANTENEVIKRWYLLFEEYQTKEHLVFFLFYPIFFIRRLIYIAVLIGLKDYGYLQIGFNITHSILVKHIQVSLYVIIFKPFSWRTDQILNVLVECINTVCFIMLIFYQLDVSSSVVEGMDYTIVVLAITVIVCGFIQAFIQLFRSINRYRNLNNDINTDADLDNTVVPNGFNEFKGSQKLHTEFGLPVIIGEGEPFQIITSPEHKKSEMGFFSRIKRPKQETITSQ